MINRWIGILSAFCAILATSGVVWRDIVPEWLAGDPPPSEAESLAPGQERRAQVGIYDGQGRCLGHSWTQSHRKPIGEIVMVETITALRPMFLPSGASTPPVLVETNLVYRQNESRVDELDFRIHGLGIEIHLRGEAVATGQFPCEWQVGDRTGIIVMDTTAPAALGDVIRPFDRLPNLYVGRSWRLQLIDPLSQILPNIKQTGLNLEPILIQVTGEETIEHDGRMVEVFVVEGGGATAYVARDGRVLRQVIAGVPLLGRLEILAEPFDNDARIAAIAEVRGPGMVRGYDQADEQTDESEGDDAGE